MNSISNFHTIHSRSLHFLLFYLLIIFSTFKASPSWAVPSDQRFSAPDTSLYSLNDNTTRSFPRETITPFGGNGHASSWDGRIYIATHSGGLWRAQVLRPERIERTNDGINLNGAFSSRVTVDNRDNRIGTSGRRIAPTINWLGIIPDPQYGEDNPFR